MPRSIPILFKDLMVKQIMAGVKNMTRRIAKNTANPPYSPGDVLWVKESHYLYGKWVKHGLSKKTNKQRWRFVPEKLYGQYNVKYMDRPPNKVFKNTVRNEKGWFKRSSLFMPKKCSRISLKVELCRLENLQDINEYNAEHEGIEQHVLSQTGTYGQRLTYVDYSDASWPGVSAINSFRSLWIKINGQQSWDENPKVWVVEFYAVSSIY